MRGGGSEEDPPASRPKWLGLKGGKARSAGNLALSLFSGVGTWSGADVLQTEIRCSTGEYNPCRWCLFLAKDGEKLNAGGKKGSKAGF